MDASSDSRKITAFIGGRMFHGSGLSHNSLVRTLTWKPKIAGSSFCVDEHFFTYNRDSNKQLNIKCDIHFKSLLFVFNKSNASLYYIFAKHIYWKNLISLPLRNWRGIAVISRIYIFLAECLPVLVYLEFRHASWISYSEKWSYRIIIIAFWETS